MDRRYSRSGQSFIEILIGIALGAIFIIGVASIVAPALRTNTQVTQVQIRAQVANELIQDMQSWAGGNWNGVLALATGTANNYYLSAATSSFSAVTGTQSVAINSQTYIRSFYLSDVYRDANGNVTTTVATSNYDPSTKQVTVVVNNASSTMASTTYVFYATRNGSNFLSQVGWAGGSGQSGPITLTGNSYDNASNITVNASGSLQLSVPAGGTCQI